MQDLKKIIKKSEQSSKFLSIYQWDILNIKLGLNKPIENIIKNNKHIKNNQVLKHEFSITIIVDVINKLNIVTK